METTSGGVITAEVADEALRRLETDCIDLVEHHEILRVEDPYRICDDEVEDDAVVRRRGDVHVDGGNEVRRADAGVDERGGEQRLRRDDEVAARRESRGAVGWLLDARTLRRV